jgi:murein DD-endopeptidase MepM/ murein hydrolase activator NlpD
MSEALRGSGKHVRLAMAGVAAMLLGGCADASRMGDPFGDPFKSSSAQFDRTPTGTVNQPQVAANQAPGFDPGSFFADAFKPFDAPSAPPPAARAPATVPRYSAPKPIAVQSQPLAAPSFPAVAAPASPVFAPAAPVSSASIVRSAPNAVGGWTSEGGVPVVVGQGESAESIATRYGVPTATLLSINGYANRSQVTPGSRLTIPVYHASGAVRAAAAPAAHIAPQVIAPQVSRQVAPSRQAASVAAPAVAPRAAQVAKLEAPKAPTLALKPDPAAAQAEKRAKAAQAKADEAAHKLAVAQAAQEKAAQEKVAQAQAAQAKSAKAQVAQQAVQAKTAKAEAAKASAVKEAAAKQLSDKKLAAAKAVTVATPAKPVVEAQTLAAVKPAPPAKAQQIASAAPILPAAPVQAAPVAAVKPQAAAPVETTASLPSAAAGAGASDSANPEFRWPARGRVIQSFGAAGNDGINIAVPEGTQVKAAEGGVVAYAGSELKGYGNLVLIRHPNGFVSAYANNGSINVKRGENVKRGQTIALSGQTGNVASPQLHFELRKGQKPVDPSNYLAGL